MTLVIRVERRCWCLRRVSADGRRRGKKNVRNVKRNRGEEYVSQGGKVVAAQKVGPDCKCKNKCFAKVGADNISDI